jgi:hypothetical protein
MALLLVSCSKSADQSTPQNTRPAAMTIGDDFKSSGILGKVVASGNQDYEYTIAEESNYGYALFNQDQVAYAVFHPKKGDVVKILYSQGVWFHNDKKTTLYAAKKNTISIIQNLETY